MTELEEKVRKIEYDRLKELVGKKKADKLFKKSNYPLYAIGFAVIKAELINAFKKSPILTAIIVIPIVAYIIYHILNFFFWI